MNRYKAYFILIDIVFVIVVLTINPDIAKIDLFEIAIAASFGGRAISYMKIFEWLREPFASSTNHPSGIGEYVETDVSPFGYTPKWRMVIGDLLSCQVCTGMWVGNILLLTWPFLPALTHALAVGGGANIVTYTTELLEWAKCRNWEEAGYYKTINKKERRS